MNGCQAPQFTFLSLPTGNMPSTSAVASLGLATLDSEATVTVSTPKENLAAKYAVSWILLGEGSPNLSVKIMEAIEANAYVDFEELPPAKPLGKHTLPEGSNTLL